MTDIKHLTMEELEAGLDEIRQSPKEEGVLKMIVCRPQIDAREVLEEGLLNLNVGLVGDNWMTRGGTNKPDDPERLENQLTLMNSRAIALIAQDQDRWPLAGDQLYVDLDLSDENLPAGTQLSIGMAVVEVTALPHTGCKKFAERFGPAATKFVNSPVGKPLNLRGINAKIIQPGVIRAGDVVKKL